MLNISKQELSISWFIFIWNIIEVIVKSVSITLDRQFSLIHQSGFWILQVELAKNFGDATKPRAWSKYSRDSSAYQKMLEKLKEKEEVAKKNKNSDEKVMSSNGHIFKKNTYTANSFTGHYSDLRINSQFLFFSCALLKKCKFPHSTTRAWGQV